MGGWQRGPPIKVERTKPPRSSFQHDKTRLLSFVRVPRTDPPRFTYESGLAQVHCHRRRPISPLATPFEHLGDRCIRPEVAQSINQIFIPRSSSESRFHLLTHASRFFTQFPIFRWNRNFPIPKSVPSALI